MIISVDGHVTASIPLWREYLERRWHEEFDAWAAHHELTGSVKDGLETRCQWDSGARLRMLETQGVVAEVLFPNGFPFGRRRFEDAPPMEDPARDRAVREAYNRWLADFCAEAPGRRAGQALVAFDDVDGAVRTVQWAKEHGLGGINMPALAPDGPAFFDPVLDPVWAACQETGLPISQHGGAGATTYHPPGFASIMTLAIEQEFFSGRSLWQLILGGVFDRFPGLKVVYVETGFAWVSNAIRDLDRRLAGDDDWMSFARLLGRERAFTGTASDYWKANCYLGISPFTIEMLDANVLDDSACTTVSQAMFGADIPHFESIWPDTKAAASALMEHPSVTADDADAILFGNAATVYGFDAADAAA